jgi:predicted DNA-binding transcriptional regulator YafY
MNKLHVALKLLRLLNERKSINSKIVADEFNVSLRTAQRYLLELSSMPCVVVSEEGQDYHYGLSTDYKLKDPLLRANEFEHVLVKLSRSHQEKLRLNDTICLMCGKSRGKLVETPNMIGRDNRQNINLLVSIVKKQLANGKCHFP